MHARGKWRLWRGLVVLASSFACLFPVTAAAGTAPPAPNFLVIQVDDQANNTFKPSIMPRTYKWLVDHGTLFKNGLAAPPLCCPDRAGVLTGQYPHNNGVFTNDPGYGNLLEKRTTLPVWLHRAGYRTALVGKFLNHYEKFEGDRPAPGFDEWFSYDSTPGYHNYSVSNNGRHVTFGSGRRGYSTHVFTRVAQRFIDSASRGSRPFFLWLAYNAPHNSKNVGGKTKLDFKCPVKAPAPPGLRELSHFAHLQLPKDPSFNEANVSDKPPWVADEPRLSPERIGRIQHRYRCSAATIHAADNDIGKIRSELRFTGELGKTIVIYLSDNGYFFGEHRLGTGKVLPYESDLQIPFAARVPEQYREVKQPKTSDAVVSNTDIAPTLLDYAGNPPACNKGGHCRVPDGRSLRPLLSGVGTFPEDRGVLAEINTRFDGEQFAYDAIRTPDRFYVDYGGFEQELYNLDTDPFELRNLAGNPLFSTEQLDLSQRLSALTSCSGTTGAQPCE